VHCQPQNASKIVWGPDSARTHWRRLQLSPDPLAGFRGEKKGRRKRNGRVEKGRGGEGKG